METEKLKNELINELISTITKLTNVSDLLCIVCSYGDTLTEDEVLAQLKDWNTLYSANNS